MHGKTGCLLVGTLVTASLAVVGLMTGIVVAVVPLAFTAVLLAVSWQFDELDGHIGRLRDLEQDIHYPFGPPKNLP